MSKVRQRRSTWVGILVVVVFFTGVTFAIAMVGSGGPDIPHSAAEDHAGCVTCHPTDGLPDGHHDRVDDSCRSCHSEKSADAGVPAGSSLQRWDRQVAKSLSFPAGA